MYICWRALSTRCKEGEGETMGETRGGSMLCTSPSLGWLRRELTETLRCDAIGRTQHLLTSWQLRFSNILL
jgi:hypothetical protein